MKPVLLICLAVFIALLLLGWSLWIGVGLGLYWLAGWKAMKTIRAWDLEDGNDFTHSYADEWMFRGFVIFAGGLLGIVIGCVAIIRKWEKKKTYKSWFE